MHVLLPPCGFACLSRSGKLTVEPQLTHIESIGNANRILSNVKYVAIATVSSSGEPWCTPVHATCDDEFNIYWSSTHDAIHSQNIRANSRAFLTIFDSTQPENENPRGFYLRCTAKELNDPVRVDAARKVTCAKAGGKPNVDLYLGESPRRVYVATPEELWVNNLSFEGPHWIDRREPIASLDVDIDRALRQP